MGRAWAIASARSACRTIHQDLFRQQVARYFWPGSFGTGFGYKNLCEPNLLRAELRAERVVPVVGDLADRLEEVFELFEVEARQPAQGAHHHLVTVRVDRERRVGGGEKRQL